MCSCLGESEVIQYNIVSFPFSVIAFSVYIRYQTPGTDETQAFLSQGTF